MADGCHGNLADVSSPAASAAATSTAITAVPAPHRRPSLLPAFEPLSSSPGQLPRPPKRKLDDLFDGRTHYPTPVPTSSTDLIYSSSPRHWTRPSLQRNVSTLSERAPLGDVPTLTLPENGEPLLLGRSSNSSNYQLPGNRQISRIHIRACFLAPTTSHPSGVVEIQCLGWNGAKVHCRGEKVDLAKGEVYRSDLAAQIMLDVQDTRVMLLWPKVPSAEVLGSRQEWTEEEEESPMTKHRAVSVNHALASSPPPMLPPPRMRSPVSPTPAASVLSTFPSTFRVDTPDDGEVKVYEDHSSDGEAPRNATPEPQKAAEPIRLHSTSLEDPFTTSRADGAASEPEEFSEHDEENDPIVHSFGPFGENILSRFESFQHTSPERKRASPAKKPFTSPPPRPLPQSTVHISPIKNHVINQLAFSRIHSLPLSQIHSNLPAELRGAMARPSDTENRAVLTSAELKTILDLIPCVGEIAREGKDAHGKLLESEFYYVPEMDVDDMRRETVTQSLGKTSLRAARKQHKQYYWKRPR